MRFHDQARIELIAGDGGDGCVAFRREKFIARGGPNGGNGGRGGDIYARAIAGLNTLLDYRYRRRIASERGGGGQGKMRSGRSGASIVLDLPQGTQIYDERDGGLLADLVSLEERILLCKGGRGGYGNAHFRSSTNRSPRMAQKGDIGEHRSIVLRLKVLADVGLAGLPNAGKSSLLRKISGSRTKVADYAYTTLHPHLGLVSRNYEEAVFADLPGLIEGASSGAGLGHRFLAHMERCSILLHLVEIASEATSLAEIVERALTDFRVVEKELSFYGCGLLGKRRLLLLTKSDLLAGILDGISDEDLCAELCTRVRDELQRGRDATLPEGDRLVEGVFLTSSLTGFGVPALLDRVFALLLEERE